ncbi:N-acetylglucosaminyl-diphospho-decaprenol L-rhamnosyltransferase [subsurface metagenome]
MVSIIIVNYNAGRLLKECIDSIYKESIATPFDVWVVDNNSQDDSITMIKEYFPRVNVIENRTNIGFSKGNNMVISKTKSDYVLLLNPDTIIVNHAIEKMVRFMYNHPETGISGCKVLNEDGTVQLASRRSIPTPRVAFFRLSGLSRLFPKSKIMAKYNLTYLDPDEPEEVDAVSGAFLMIRRKVIEEIGLLDERFFMYGEELDWCLRTKKAGWTVMYYPDAEIIHYKGECSKSNSRKATFEFYRSMYLFHKKHFAENYNPIINIIIYAGILLKALMSWRSFLFSAKVGSKR